MNMKDENNNMEERAAKRLDAPAFMLRASARKATDERRTFVRIPYVVTIDYIDGNGYAGDAHSVDIGWGGFSMMIGRYLRPGMRIEIGFPGEGGGTEELVGVVTWCRTVDDQNFSAGVQVSLDESDAVARLSARILAAVVHGDDDARGDRTGGPGDVLGFAMTAPHVA